VTNLTARTQNLRRRIYASLPWGYRVANLFLYIASRSSTIMGRVIQDELVRQGFNVPAGWANNLTRAIYAKLLIKAKNPSLADDVFSELMLKLTQKKFEFDPKSSLTDVGRYLYSTAFNVLTDIYRRETRGINNRKEDSKRVFLDPDELTNLEDPDTFRALDRMLPRHEISHLMRDLKKVDDRAPSWFEAKLEGWLSKEIATEWGVSPARISQWESLNVPDIREVLNKYIQDAA